MLRLWAETAEILRFAQASAGGAEFVMIPERDYDIGDVCRKILEGAARGKKHSIIIKAEGSKLSSQEVVDKISEITGKDTRMVGAFISAERRPPTSDDRVLQQWRELKRRSFCMMMQTVKR